MHTKSKGFTLAELLIALGILGLIAAFTIPKILDAGTSSKNKTVLKQTISAMDQVVSLGVLTGELTTDTPNVITYIAGKLNAVQICETDAEAEGCWSVDPYPSEWSALEKSESGAILHNGVKITGIFNSNSYGADYFVIDANGDDGPNRKGEDQLYLAMCYDSDGTLFSNYCTQEGTIIPNPGYANSAANLALWDSLWQ